MIELIQRRLDSYGAKNAIQEEQATKEIIQEIALYALWRADFFDVAAFQGGTSLRILHKLPRFSENLDFMLKEANQAFDWSLYLKPLLACFEEFGLKSEALPKGAMDNRIKKAVIKDNSIVNQLDLAFYSGPETQKLKIKLEVDVDPPGESGYDYTYLNFPLDFEVCHQDLSSNFALKCHALLCRQFLKGRDWYDLVWYARQGVSPNLVHLKNALKQYGPWAGQENLLVDPQWLRGVFKEKIALIEWREAAADVERFLPPPEQHSLRLWNEGFFSEKIEGLFS